MDDTTAGGWTEVFENGESSANKHRSRLNQLERTCDHNDLSSGKCRRQPRNPQGITKRGTLGHTVHHSCELRNNAARRSRTVFCRAARTPYHAIKSTIADSLTRGDDPEVVIQRITDNRAEDKQTRTTAGPHGDESPSADRMGTRKS